MKHAIPQGLEMWLTQKVNSNDSETLLTLSKVHANAYSPVCVCLNNWGFSNVTPMLTWKLESNFHVTFKCNLHCCCSVNKSCPTLCDPMDCSTPGFPVLHHRLGFAQTHVHWVSDAIQPSYPLSSPSPIFDLSQHQGLFQWVSSSHQVAKVLELQLQHQFFPWGLNVCFFW